jgi:antitoxin component of MazEF toxin-antitoxin module
LEPKRNRILTIEPQERRPTFDVTAQQVEKLAENRSTTENKTSEAQSF